MADKPIQLGFGDELVTVISRLLEDESIRVALGDRLMEAVKEFARRDMDSAVELENKYFRFVSDAPLRQEIAQTFYGARWLYKLGLALLAKDEEPGDHVRAQVTDYGAVAEALLSYAVAHAIKGERTQGNRYRYSDFVKLQKPIVWDVKHPEKDLASQTFAWLIAISFDFGIIHNDLKKELHWLREQRNSVHLRKLVAVGRQAFLSRSLRAFEAVVSTSKSCRAWCLRPA